MTTELEQEFFDTFGIENRFIIQTHEKLYPEITAEKLLEIMCILSQSYPLNYEGWSFNTVQNLKETILEDCIETAKRLSLSSVFANKIQQLFNEDDRMIYIETTMLDIITDEEEY